MVRVLIAVLIGWWAFNLDATIAQWHAVYPSDPALEMALQHCYTENHQFNRLSAEARRGCYDKWLPQIEARQAPV